MEAKTNPIRWPITAVSTLAMLSALSVAQAGKIVSTMYNPYAPNAPGFVAQGFGGWNLDNIVVNIFDGEYDYLDGSYTFGAIADGTYSSDVYDGDPEDPLSTNMSRIIAKPWPIGEPPGIKVINNDFAVNEKKPTNCIISTSYLEDHYLNSDDPQQVICSSGFQTHKRYKQAMLPGMVADGAKGTDMVFNVEPEAEAGSRDYQVFQKINNWTGERLAGFTIEVGFGVGEGFVKAGNSAAGVANLSLSVPGDVWAADQLATFSHGLFGEIDKHFPTPGFFDNISAGYSTPYPVDAGITDTLSSGAMLDGEYRDVPPGGQVGANQFGPWLPNIWLPWGIFFDTDGNPDTDADLVAWYGYNPDLAPTPDNPLSLGWMTGNSEGFQAISDETILALAGDLAYSMGVIDDLVNVGLNYIVTIGDVSTFPGSTFTIRITPVKDTSGIGAPTFVGQTPVPMLTYASSTAQISLNPSPEFLVGDPLFVRVGDADANTDPAAIDTLTVHASSSSAQCPPEPVSVELAEEGEDRGVFVAKLPDCFSDVAPDTEVTVTYDDNGTAISASSIAKTETTIAPSYVTISNLNVPGAIKGGSTRTIKVRVSLDIQAPTAESGTVIVTANGVIVDDRGFLLEPNQSYKYDFDWTAPDTAQTITWVASATSDTGAYIAPVTATTEVKAVQPNKP